MGIGSEALTIDTSKSPHDFQPHEHVPYECSAQFYRDFFGCDASPMDGRPECNCVGGVHRNRASITGVLPDPIYAPEAPESWLAMKGVLAEGGRRGWFADIDVTSESASVRFATNPANEADGSPWFKDSLEGLPRAVILAAWASAIGETA